ncbi:MAG: NAD(P)H-hydrate dehydratase [Clostridia bacterium]|nr:NAD(P)H-hydrate dehydratase [Clostridia bacterium]
MKILSLDQIRATENAVFASGTSADELMCRVGEAAADVIIERYHPIGKKVIVVCGNGNNGGDGFVIAHKLYSAGAKVFLWLPLGDPATETAQHQFESVREYPRVYDLPNDTDLVIDAIFGIGLNRAVREPISDYIGQINLSEAPCVSIDIPSGVFCNDGAFGAAVRADLTLTAIAAKPCFFLPPASETCGEVVVLDVGVPIEDYTCLTVEKPIERKRAKNAHKGTFGKAALFCGSYGMCGAQILAARAALRSGVGIVQAVVCDRNYPAFCVAVPEAVTYPVLTGTNGCPVVSEAQIGEILKKADAVLVGPGLGATAESERLVKNILQMTEIPIVLDADGINVICRDISIIKRVKAPVIITPHPGEMARLFQTTVEKVESNRLGYAKKFATEFNCVVVLKGANTVIAAPDGRLFINTTGNPGMATGGSGDVLAGMIVSLLAQGATALSAATTAVYRHGEAGDRAARRTGECALLPSDLIDALASPDD